MAARVEKDWDAAIVRTWLAARIAAAKADQVVAERGGRDRQDDCDKASAEEMACTLVGKAADNQASLLAEVQRLLDRDEYIWRGVYNDTRFDRHVRSYAKKLLKMAKTNEGFENTTHYQ